MIGKDFNQLDDLKGRFSAAMRKAWTEEIDIKSCLPITELPVDVDGHVLDMYRRSIEIKFIYTVGLMKKLRLNKNTIAPLCMNYYLGKDNLESRIVWEHLVNFDVNDWDSLLMFLDEPQNETIDCIPLEISWSDEKAIRKMMKRSLPDKYDPDCYESIHTYSMFLKPDIAAEFYNEGTREYLEKNHKANGNESFFLYEAEFFQAFYEKRKQYDGIPSWSPSYESEMELLAWKIITYNFDFPLDSMPDWLSTKRDKAKRQYRLITEEFIKNHKT
jgi:hypothetical protein